MMNEIDLLSHYIAIGNNETAFAMLNTENVNVPDQNGSKAIHFAATFHNVDCLKQCIRLGANVNDIDFGGCSPLYLTLVMVRNSAPVDPIPTVRVLLENGAVISDDDDEDLDFLQRCIVHHEMECFELFLDYGAKLPRQPRDEFPAWVIAILDKRQELRKMIRLLIGINKYIPSAATGRQDKGVIIQIAKHIWSFRME